jgi:hypothetical protein
VITGCLQVVADVLRKVNGLRGGLSSSRRIITLRHALRVNVSISGTGNLGVFGRLLSGYIDRYRWRRGLVYWDGLNFSVGHSRVSPST